MASVSSSKFLSYLIKFAGVFLASLMAMKISGMLVIPPGQASIIWPAAGIAVGAILTGGRWLILPVFLAAFIKSLWYYDEIGANELLTAASIATGASLQAYVAVTLIQKYIKSFNLFEDVRETSLFLILAGPLACSVNATIATSALIIFGVISSDQFLAHAATWWLGDIFGVVLFAPLTVLIMSTKKGRGQLSLRRKMLVGLPLILSFIVFVLLFCYVVETLKDRSLREYESETSKITRSFRQELYIDLTSTIAISSFITSSEYVSAEEFNSFVSPILKYTRGVYGFSWIPKVENSAREDFVKSIREQGFPNFEIVERNAEGKTQKASSSDVYFPLAYTEPYELNKLAHGLNVYGHDGISGGVRKNILDTAKALEEARGTARFSIVQKQSDYGFIIYHPVFKDINGQYTHIGYVNGIFVFDQMMHETYLSARQVSSEVILIDKTHEKAAVLYDSRSPDYKELSAEKYDFEQVTHVVDKVSVAGRDWELVYLRGKGQIDDKYLQEIWVFAAGGIIFNLLLSLILILVTARNDYIESLVKIRTKELQEANQELEEFTYRTSHDLRSPLVSSKGIAELIVSAVDSDEPQKIKQASNFLIESIEKLLVLIDDIMQLAEAKNKEEAIELIDLKDLVKQSISKFSYMANFNRLKIETEFSDDTKIHTKASRIRLILENLISNSIKYQDTDDKNSYIRITAHKSGNQVTIKIEDNGLGVPEENQEDLFGMFNRFHTKVSYGSGLGLYMVKKSTEILGGSVEFEPLDKGSRFVIKMPEFNG